MSCPTTAGKVKGFNPKAETISTLEIINISPVPQPQTGPKRITLATTQGQSHYQLTSSGKHKDSEINLDS